ncbi:copper chaperone (CCH)-related protein-like protein [Trifolium pratense]|uniref:Copper chaperone (CCH)-related protein-like protein n=1 Tax=Trifolium pratense TaxID=57577 RepID=A0A2K3NVE8_TRIPR|nr:copper chaperone (CCH)-related protein-like protein [Trifolium pratense]
MKRMDIFCASQASTAICLSMEQASCSSSNTIQLGGRVIDRHNPIINDSRRSTSKTITAPCSSSQLPIDPKKKTLSSSSSSSKPSNGHNMENGTKVYEEKKKSTAEEKVTEHVNKSYYSKPIDFILKRRSIKLPADSITPHGSTRSLLSDTAFLDASTDNDPVLALTKVDNKKAEIVGQDESNPASKLSNSSSPKSGSPDQVVVLWVSLHCRACEGKVRKHLTRMQGVSSFNIDFAAKKVTVVGDVTPFSVLESISKVKNAQFWPEVGSDIKQTKFI